MKDGQDDQGTLDLIGAAVMAGAHHVLCREYPESRGMRKLAAKHHRRVESLANGLIRQGAELASKAPCPHRAATRSWRA